MKDKAEHAKGWFRKAESDLANARRTIASEGPYDTACFHAQQAAEKYLKGLMAYHEMPILRTHDIEELFAICQSFFKQSNLSADELSLLTDYGVPARYDFDFWPELDVAKEALTLAIQIKVAVLKNFPDNFID